MDLLDIFWMLVRIIAVFAGVMTMVPILIWMERKVVAGFQFRVGPNRLGPFGLMQPLADALKLIMKEDITPSGADRVLYFMAPLLAMIVALLAAAVIPFGPMWWSRITELDHSVLYSFALSSLAVYAIALGGWSSNNKYSLLGALRSASQMISYELGMGLAIITLVMLVGTTSLSKNCRTAKPARLEHHRRRQFLAGDSDDDRVRRLCDLRRGGNQSRAVRHG